MFKTLLKPFAKLFEFQAKTHYRAERHSMALTFGIILAASVGGFVEIAPLFWLENTIEKVEGVRPYSPLELTGRDIYVREGCYLCHSQMIRPMRDEVERYGHYSLAAESMYDHPFQWGSKRTGPDVARVGGRYSDAWHVDHLSDPQSVVPESIMPKYAFLADTRIDADHVQDLLKTHRFVGVPYTDEQIEQAASDFKVQADPDADYDAMLARYPGAAVSNFDGAPELTEMDALIAHGRVASTAIPGALSPHEEFPAAVATAIRAN